MTNPSTPPGDFEVAQAVADQLKGLPRDRQERVLRWVAESLGVPVASRETTSRETTKTPGNGGDSTRQRPPTPSNIRSFVEAKQPASDVQFATVAAYFYRFEAPEAERRETIDAAALREAARLADRQRLASPNDTLHNAKKTGYLDNKGRGAFSINSVGENLVAMALPGGSKPGPKKAKKKSKTKARARRK